MTVPHGSEQSRPLCGDHFEWRHLMSQCCQGPERRVLKPIICGLHWHLVFLHEDTSLQTGVLGSCWQGAALRDVFLALPCS